ncbi:MAG: HAMP domain-containing histidine kinase [Pelosinus sp.]|nr:HAMP domain-containing histidine kinase [Pelosinus sp.]
MRKLNSITFRITGLTFLAIAFTVLILIYLANVQMTEQFKEYRVVQQMEMSKSGYISGQMVTVVMGPLEESFLMSVHKSLIWVGLAILALGLAASFFLARSITVPLRKLSQAAQQMEQGMLGQTVVVETKDEVGHLAKIFNRMSEKLATSDKLRKQLLANIAHELRTPLAVIQGHLEGMIDGVIEANGEQLRSLHEEAVRLNRLITDLRDLSLAEVRQLTLEKQPANLNGLVTRTLGMLKPLTDEKGIKVDCTLAENLPEVAVDADRMCQVLYNIFVNAIRYSPFNGLIEVNTALINREERKWLKVSITDHGPGITLEDIPYVFDHFYRGDKSRDRKSGGSGLGLAIVRQLVENHAGEVSVESAEGKGSIFHVLLPVDS